MVCELLLERGDYVLTEEYTYPSVIESVIIPKGYRPLGVKLDQNGIRPESLLEVALSWSQLWVLLLCPPKASSVQTF